METKRDFYAEMNKRRRELLATREGHNNCASTALYLVGERGADNYLPSYIAEMLINDLKEEDKPALGSILVFEDSDKNLKHLAVVVQENPLRLTARNGEDAPFIKSQSYGKLCELYSSIDAHPTKFLIPSKLQKILEMEAQQ